MRKMIKNRTARVGLAVLAIFFVATAGSCEGDSKPTTQTIEADRRQSNLDRLAASQPAATMNYSPTRQTVNFWMETWDEPGKLSYVYLRASNGQMVGYYVLEGLPVSYCVGITQPYDVFNWDGGQYGMDYVVPAAGMDGAYYGGCNDRAYYGKDATTGAYIEYTLGDGQSVFLYDQPLDVDDAQPLGYTLIGDDGEVESTG